MSKSSPATLKVGKWDFLPSTPEDHVALVDSMKVRLVPVPIIAALDGTILDGHRRFKAYQELKITDFPISWVDTSNMEEAEVRALVLTLNMNRRHMTPELRREQIGLFIIQHSTWSNRRIGLSVGACHKTVGTIRDKLVAEGKVEPVTETEGEDGRTRTTTPDRPSVITTGVLSPNQQKRKNVRKDWKNKKNTSKYNPELGVSGIDIRNCDFRKLEVADSSVKLIFTDPPYVQDWLANWEALAEFCNRVLVPGGVLVSYSPTVYMPQVLDAFRKHLTYVWQMAITFQGNKRALYKWKFQSGYRPVLVFVKGDYGNQRLVLDRLVGDLKEGEEYRDIIMSTGQEKQLHPWQQSIDAALTWIPRFTNAGDLVCDPCGGSFTTAEACLRTGRRFVGCDIEEGYAALGQERVAKVEKELSAQRQAS